LYSGEQFDAKIGQQYLRARYYDPATGRFNRLDPFFGNQLDPQSLHNYLYAHVDPVNGIDPSGLFSIGGMMSSLGISGNMRGMNVGVVTQVAKQAITNVLKGVAKRVVTNYVFDRLIGDHLDDIKREMVLLSLSLAGVSPQLVNVANGFISILQEIGDWLSLGSSFIPTPLNVITSVWKALPGEYGQMGASVSTAFKWAKKAKYAAVAATAGFAVPIFVHYSGKILTEMGYPTNINVPFVGGIAMDAQFLLGAMPFIDHGQRISFAYLPIAAPLLAEFIDWEYDEFNVLYAVEFDKIISQMRDVAQLAAQNSSKNLIKEAAKSYVENMHYWFSPHISVEWNF
jgi:RHS repeat-associated protein